MHKKRETAVNYILLYCGAILAAFALSEFLVPNSIFDGGITGISMIIHRLTGISLGVFIVILNIPFLLYALKSSGKVFVFRATTAIIVFSVMEKVFDSLPGITDDVLLATIFGGLFLGCGCGLVLRSGGCLDGSEIVGIFVNRRYNLSVGKTVLIINIVIYFIAGVLFGIDKAMYSILMYIITSRVIDFVQTGLEQAKAIQVITEDGEHIADEIYNNFGRTVTFIRGEGLISGTKKDILYCVITRAEIFRFRKLISDLDVNAFITITDVSEIIGNHIKLRKGIRR